MNSAESYLIRLIWFIRKEIRWIDSVRILLRGQVILLRGQVILLRGQVSRLYKRDYLVSMKDKQD